MGHAAECRFCGPAATTWKVMIRNLVLAACIGLLMLGPLIARGHEYHAGTLYIDHPHARPTPPGARAGAAYLSVANKGGAPDRLLRASSPRAASVELHSMSMDGNVMRMRAVPAVALPAGATVKLEPGGLHLMLTGLKQPLKAGERFLMTLVFEKAGSLAVEIAVEEAGAAASAAKAGAHAGH
jgi:copper(I)-binding protein